MAPLEKLANIYRIPGITPDLAQQAFQMAQAGQFFGSQEPKEPGIRPSMRSKPREEVKDTQEIKVGPDELKTTETEWASPAELEQGRRNRFVSPDSPRRKDIARKYYDLGMATTDKDAFTLADQEIATDTVANQTKIAEVNELLNKRTGLTLQQAGLYDPDGKVPGRVMQLLQDQAQHLVLENDNTPEEAAAKMEKVAFTLAEDADKMKKAAKFTKVFSKKGKIISDIQQIRPDFKKYGVQNEFDNMAIAELGISPMAYYSKIEPLKNEKIAQSLQRKWTSTPQQGQRMDSVLKSIRNGDNIFSIYSKMLDKGISLGKFKDKALEMYDNGEINLSDIQLRDLKVPVSESPIGDIIFNVFQ
jgi:hypothetical protein